MSQSLRPPSDEGGFSSPADWSSDQWGQELQKLMVVFRHAGRRNGRLSDADQDDLCQAAALAIWESRGSIDPTRPLFLFAYGLALKSAANIRRGNQRRVTNSVSDEDAVADGIPSSPEVAEDDERQNAVRSFLAALPTQDRTIMTMRYCERRPLNAVALAVGLSRATVHRHRRRLVAKAKRQLVDWAA